MLKCEKKVSLEFLFHRKAFLSVFCIRIISVVDVSASQAGKKKEERRKKEKGKGKREEREKGRRRSPTSIPSHKLPVPHSPLDC